MQRELLENFNFKYPDTKIYIEENLKDKTKWWKRRKR